MKLTKFNEEDILQPIFKIKDKEDAVQYKKSYIDYLKSKGYDDERASEIVNSNIGYYAGYGSNEDRKRIENLFLCSHPIFGSVKENGVPTAKEALECGKQRKTLKEIRK